LRKPPIFAIDDKAQPRHLVAEIGRMQAVLGAPAIKVAQGVEELCTAEVLKVAKA
jgi:hypothetical protein